MAKKEGSPTKGKTTFYILAQVVPALIVLGGIGWWLSGQFSGLRLDLSKDITNARSDLSKEIQSTRTDLMKDVGALAQRVSALEGEFKRASASGRTQVAELERKLAISHLANMLVLSDPAAMKGAAVVGSVDRIDLQKRIISIEDIQGGKFTFSIAHEAIAKAYGPKGAEPIQLKDVKPGNPVAIRYETKPNGERAAQFIGKSQWEFLGTKAEPKAEPKATPRPDDSAGTPAGS